MIVKSFKNQEPLNIILLLIITIVLRLPYLLSSAPIPEYHYSEPFSVFLFEKLFFLWDNKTTNVIITSLIIFIQALWLNKIVFDFSLLFKNSYLPALFYVVLTATFPTFFTMDGAIVSIFFLLWILVKLFKLHKSHNAMAIVFDVGMIIAMASLFYFPAVMWLLVVFFALSVFRAFSWREWQAAVTGFIVPYLFIAVYYYWVGHMDLFVKIWKPLLGDNFWKTNIPLSTNDFYPLIPILLIFLISLNKLRENFYKNVVQVRKCQQVLIAVIFITAIAYYIKPSFRLNHFILLAAPLAVFISYYFLVAKRKWLSELLLILLMGSIIYFQVV